MSKNSKRLIPKLRFPEFRGAGEWEEKTLEQLATYTKGFAFKSQDYRSQGLRVVRVSDLGADSIKPNNEKIFITAELASDYERYVLNKDEIIITTVGSKPDLIESAVGRGIFVHYPNEGLLNQNLLKLEALSGVNSKFIFSNINTEKYQKFIASISRGNANQANIAVKD
jgi:type I restriction enzyme, S subunit